MEFCILSSRRFWAAFCADALAWAARAFKFAVVGTVLCCGIVALAQDARTKLATIELNAQTKRVDLDGLSEYWIDDTNQASVEQVDAGFNGYGQFVARGESQIHKIWGKTLWIRFDAKILDASARWFFEAASPSVQDISLYWRDASNQWVRMRSGDATPRSQWPVLDRTPVFQLNQPQPGSHIYYLRINNDRVPFSAPLRILRDTELLAQRQVELLLIGAYVGIALMMALVSLALSQTMKERRFYYFTVYLLVLGAFQLNYLGLSGQYIHPQAVHWAYASNFVLPLIAVATGLWFVHKVIKPRQFSIGLETVGTGLITILLGLATYATFAPNPTVFQVGNAFCLAALFWAYVVIWASWTRDNHNVRWIALGFLPVALGALPGLLRNAGLIHSGFITQYGITICAIVGMPILLFSLVQRSAGRQISLARAAGLPTHDALTGLANLRHLLQQMHGASTRAQRFSKPYALYLVELTNHDWFLKEHRVEMANRALVLLGTRLQHIARDVDTAARLEGNQFILLIEGPCEPAYAAKLATKIASSAHAPSNLLPVGATLKLRITCALMPDPNSLEHGDDASAQLAWLIEHAEHATLDARKLVRTLNF